VSPGFRVEPRGHELRAEPGETVMAAARRSGLRWPTVCGGQAECGVCVLEVVDAPGGLEPPGEDEARRLAGLPEARWHPERVHRLACRLVAVDGLVVHKRGVVAAGPEG
jgi:ferredoxin, 2Fe-2S